IQVQSLIGELHKYTEPCNLNEDSRVALLKACKDMQYKLESSRETANRLHYAVSIPSLQWDFHAEMHIYQGMDLAVAHIFNTIKLLHVLIKHQESPTSTDELAKETNTDPVLLGIVTQTKPDAWSPSHITHSLAEPSSEANITEAFICEFPFLLDLPTYLSHTHYQNPSDSNDTVHHFAHKTDKHWFEWATKDNPKSYDALNQFMAVNLHAKTGIDVFPFESILPKLFSPTEPSTPLSPEQTLFIDIGGGRGQICEAFKSRFPSPPSGGRVIVQDLPQTLAGVPTPSPTGIEAIPHNFFEPNPITGAKIYYLRHVLHDWPDHKCQEILKHVKDAMDAE
ncbi:MAG: hypothetical protein L6R42_011153, partial [Xanthoria sp. 1 TBL-2021]